MLDRGVPIQERFYDKQPFTETELKDLLDGVDVATFLNPRNRIYRERKFKQNPPDWEEAVQLILQDPNLLRRPVLVVNGRRVFGFDPQEYEALAA